MRGKWKNPCLQKTDRPRSLLLPALNLFFLFANNDKPMPPHTKMMHRLRPVLDCEQTNLMPELLSRREVLKSANFPASNYFAEQMNQG